MNNMKQQFTEAMHVLSKDIKVWNKRIEQLNYPRWVLVFNTGMSSKEVPPNEGLSYYNAKLLILFGGSFDLVEDAHYAEYLVEFETEQEAITALEAMKASSHLLAVSDYVDFNTLSPMYMPIPQAEIDELQSLIDSNINQIKFFQDVLGIPNAEGTQIVETPEQQTDVVLEYGILVEKEGIDSFVYCDRYHPTYNDALDDIINGWVSVTCPDAKYSVIARSKEEQQ